MNDAPLREVVRNSVAIFYTSELPAMATHWPQASCGFSLYRGVLAVWDEDRDTRVLNFIDDLLPEDRDELLVVQEHEGSVAFIWDHYEPGCCTGEVEVCDDVWCVNSSVVLRPMSSE
jgi:hypothetical protein